MPLSVPRASLGELFYVPHLRLHPVGIIVRHLEVHKQGVCHINSVKAGIKLAPCKTLLFYGVNASFEALLPCLCLAETMCYFWHLFWQ